MKHPLTVEKYPGSLYNLAAEVASLRYDKLRNFIVYLSNEIELCAITDEINGKKQLAKVLQRTADKLLSAGICTDDAWKICEPFMTDKE